MAKKSSVQVNITIPLEWKQSDIEMVAKARAWAVKAHAGILAMIDDAPEKHKSKGWTNAMPKTNEVKKPLAQMCEPPKIIIA